MEICKFHTMNFMNFFLTGDADSVCLSCFVFFHPYIKIVKIISGHSILFGLSSKLITGSTTSWKVAGSIPNEVIGFFT
jgi:hypothetical protein